MNWFYDDPTQKSLQGLDCLVHDVILADDCDADDLHQFNAHCETKCMDDTPKDLTSSFFAADGWHTTSISIWLPCKKVKQPEDQAPQFQVQGLHYCKTTEVVKSAFEEPAAETYHTTCYDRFSSLVGRRNRGGSEVGEILTTAHQEFGGCAHRCAGKPKCREQD